MQEIIVTKPKECPFYTEQRICGMHFSFSGVKRLQCFLSLPQDCPLFVNDYLIKRRNEEETKTEAKQQNADNSVA